MRRSAIVTGLVAFFVLAIGTATRATAPGQVDFQGLLLDSAGQPATGAVDLVFDLYDAPSGGTLLWSETLSDVPLVDGVYSVTLGETTPLTPAILATGDVHLEITVDGEVLSPRRALLAVPFAVRASESAALAGQSGDFYAQIIQHFAFDGGAPANDDPSEGTGDSDGDGLPNFLDPDNDDDGIADVDEVSAGTDINLTTPTLDQITAESFPSGLADIDVTGTNFVSTMAVLFDGAPVTPENLASTSFQFTVSVTTEGQKDLVVTRPNGETASGSVFVTVIVPTITGVSTEVLQLGVAETVNVTGTNFDPTMRVDFDGDVLAPSNVTATSFDVTITATTAGTKTLTVTLANGRSDSVALTVGRIRRVFLSTGSSGNLGGVTGADAICAAAASGFGLSGTYLAWLSDASTDPASRFDQSGGPFVRLSGEKIADDWADLTDGSLDAPIHTDPFLVWSNTSTDGTHASSAPDCLGWTTNSSSETGSRAFANSTSGSWTNPSSEIGCNSGFPIYCFEQ